MCDKFRKGGVRMKNAIALGTFDGVHIAHRKVLSLPNDFKKIAVTFTKPPKMFFENRKELIMTYDQKVEVLKKLGYDEICSLDFKSVKDTEPQEFLEFLYNKYTPSLISCGFNYHFGKNGKGDTEQLKSFCKQKGIALKICPPVTQGEITVSSSLIRKLLKDGEIEKANTLLDKPFSFSAGVLNGDKRGRTIGFPTINQKYPEDLVKLKFGVYKTKVLFNGNEYQGITNIGVRPTFESDYVISETYIKDFSGNLYGENVKIEVLKFLREEKKFSSLEQLQTQIKQDLKN